MLQNHNYTWVYSLIFCQDDQYFHKPEGHFLKNCGESNSLILRRKCKERRLSYQSHSTENPLVKRYTDYSDRQGLAAVTNTPWHRVA